MHGSDRCGYGKPGFFRICFLTFPFRRGNEMSPCDPSGSLNSRAFPAGGYHSEPFAFSLHGKNR
jgi:hypothetical protein